MRGDDKSDRTNVGDRTLHFEWGMGGSPSGARLVEPTEKGNTRILCVCRCTTTVDAS